MLTSQFTFYLGKGREHGYSDFLAEDPLFIAVDIESGFTKELGKELLRVLKEKLGGGVDSLYSFEHYIADVVKNMNVPAHISMAVGFRKGDIIYLKTIGSGQIFLHRKNDFAKLIENDNSASGYLQDGDTFVFTNNYSVKLLGGDKLESIVSGQSDAAPDLSAHLTNGDTGAVYLFSNFYNELPGRKAEPVQKTEVPQVVPQKQSFFSKLKSFPVFSSAYQAKSKRVLTIMTVGLIFVVLLWSVVFGYQRRADSETAKQIESSKEIINHKLSQADDVAFLNLPAAIALIDQAKEELNKLKKELGNKNQGDVAKLSELITQKEELLVKKEQRAPEEFFDLTVDDKSASGDLVSLSGDSAVIADKKRGVAYILSLSKKSLTERNSSKIKTATSIVLSDSTVYFFVPSEGVYSLDDSNHTKKVIDNDTEWGTIGDMKLFGSNLYLLDKRKNDVYKYTPVDTGFSSKISYLKGQTLDLSSSNSLAIDGSLYIGLPDSILKFTASIGDDFNTVFPKESDINIDRVVTSDEVDNVFAVDTKAQSVYVLGKNGAYQRQIKSPIFGKSSQVIAYKNLLYVVHGPKIYTVSSE